MTIDVNWFQGRIRDLGTSQRQVSSAIASNPNTISLILSGKRRVTHEEIPMLAQLLETTPEEVLNRLGVQQPTAAKANAIDIIGYVNETGQVTINPRGRQAEAPSGATANTRAVIMAAMGGEHMQHGWVYYFDEAAKPKQVDADSLNRLCLVEVGDNDGYQLGIVRRGLERGKFDLANPFSGQAIVSGITIRSASPVSWIKTI